MARRRKAQMELEMGAPVGAAVEAQVASDVLVAVQGTAPVSAWRVARTTRVSLFGQLTTLPAGTRVTAAEYGPDGVRSLRSQVELIPEA